MGVPENGGFIGENRMKIDDLEVQQPYFRKAPPVKPGCTMHETICQEEYISMDSFPLLQAQSFLVKPLILYPNVG